MSSDRSGLHVLVTGASSGIGEAIARAFLARGDRVTLAARRVSLLEALAREHSERAFVYGVDLLQWKNADALVDAARSAHGPIDVLVNNAGVQIVAPTDEDDFEAGLALLAVNVAAPMRLTKLVLPEMIARKRGTIVDIASMAAIAPTPGMYYYNASKAALAAASEGLRAEVRPHGVHVVTVYPGPVTSAMESAAREKFEASRSVESIPTGDAATLARMVVRAVDHKRARVIYPRVYGIARHFPNVTRWVVDATTPALKRSRG
ncbi:MAG: SDR family NAD(P)-dependent oxidoreductase [Myxococcales bacterium]|nr:SDR family NAD(P)-dependent oxidoreductase [Myxococcales bacterium]